MKKILKRMRLFLRGEKVTIAAEYDNQLFVIDRKGNIGFLKIDASHQPQKIGTIVHAVRCVPQTVCSVFPGSYKTRYQNAHIILRAPDNNSWLVKLNYGNHNFGILHSTNKQPYNFVVVDNEGTEKIPCFQA